MVTVWKIAPGDHAWVWQDCCKRGCISVNWLNDRDFTSFSDRKEIRQALVQDNPKEGSRGAPSIWRFTHEVRQGHVVLANYGLSCVVGIGVIASGYLPPDDPRNPNRRQDYHRHARLVDWRIKEPVDLGEHLFIRPTVQLVEPQECRAIIRAYLKEYPDFKRTLDELFGEESTAEHLGPAADEAEPALDPAYAAQAGELRDKAWQQITRRRGQPHFRNMLLHRYGSRCLITGCKVVAVLEAAHIDPYRSDAHNHPGNGLLLRADIHTLFDLDLLGIEPKELHIELHPDIAEKYGKLVRKVLACNPKRRPLYEALARRYKLFRNRIQWPA